MDIVKQKRDNVNAEKKPGVDCIAKETARIYQGSSVFTVNSYGRLRHGFPGKQAIMLILALDLPPRGLHALF